MKYILSLCYDCSNIADYCVVHYEYVIRIYMTSHRNVMIQVELYDNTTSNIRP